MQASLLALPQSRNHGPDPCLILPCGITHEVLGSESHCQAGVNIPHMSLCLRHVLGTFLHQERQGQESGLAGRSEPDPGVPENPGP